MSTILNTGQRGRPRKNYTSEIGETYNRSRITAIVPGPRAGTGVRVEAVCIDCLTNFTARLSYLKSGKTKTCGCLKKANYLAHLAKLVAKMPPEAIAACWEDRSSGLTRKESASLRNIAPSTSDEAVRTYQKILDGLLEDGSAVKIYRTVLLPGSNLKKIGADNGLGPEATQYLMKSIAHKVRTSEDHRYGVASNCAAVLSDVYDRKTWKVAPPGELSRNELRRVKGKLIGGLAWLYGEVQLLLAGSLSQQSRRDMMEFIRLADDTLKSRLARRDDKVRQIRKERDWQVNKAIEIVTA